MNKQELTHIIACLNEEQLVIWRDSETQEVKFALSKESKVSENDAKVANDTQVAYELYRGEGYIYNTPIVSDR